MTYHFLNYIIYGSSTRCSKIDEHKFEHLKLLQSVSVSQVKDGIEVHHLSMKQLPTHNLLWHTMRWLLFFTLVNAEDHTTFFVGIVNVTSDSNRNVECILLLIWLVITIIRLKKFIISDKWVLVYESTLAFYILRVNKHFKAFKSHLSSRKISVYMIFLNFRYSLFNFV